jgi:hypothetical protein
MRCCMVLRVIDRRDFGQAKMVKVKSEDTRCGDATVSVDTIKKMNSFALKG